MWKLSGRVSVTFTGRPTSHAISAVCAWIDMSSLPPNAPPLRDQARLAAAILSMPSTLGTLPLIVEHALPLRVDEHPAFAIRRGLQRIRRPSSGRCVSTESRSSSTVSDAIVDRHRDARLRLKEQMLDPLRAIRVFDDVGRLGEGLLRRRRA